MTGAMSALSGRIPGGTCDAIHVAFTGRAPGGNAEFPNANSWSNRRLPTLALTYLIAPLIDSCPMVPETVTCSTVSLPSLGAPSNTEHRGGPVCLDSFRAELSEFPAG